MQFFGQILFSFILTFTASAYDPALCPKTVPSGAVPGTLGPCDVNGMCAAEAGPSDCINNICYCKTGYCSWWIEVNSKSPIKFTQSAGHYCLARAIGKICRKGTDCLAAGPGTTLCNEGVCMCVYNYRFDPFIGKCDKGWDQPLPQTPPVPLDPSMMMGGMPGMPGMPGGIPGGMPGGMPTGIPGMPPPQSNLTRLFVDLEKTPTVASNTAIISTFVAAIAVVVGIAGAAVVRSRSRALLQEEDNEYQQLQND